mmetsp:Transcript_24142/g.75467  ORF Transcript_24142/g.75467 Transcript_24142/m.75467 type:complete len:93 (+) Transcript_24142:126-404(+)
MRVKRGARYCSSGAATWVSREAATVCAHSATALYHLRCYAPPLYHLRCSLDLGGGTLFSFFYSEVRTHGNNRVKVAAYLIPVHSRNVQQMFE